jgi:hypothetical protein
MQRSQCFFLLLSFFLISVSAAPALQWQWFEKHRECDYLSFGSCSMTRIKNTGLQPFTTQTEWIEYVVKCLDTNQVYWMSSCLFDNNRGINITLECFQTSTQTWFTYSKLVDVF